MRKLIMKMSMSIDGFVGGPNGEKDWVFKSSTEDSRAWILAQTQEVGLIIMGRKSFETMSPYWPTAPGPLATAMNDVPKAVFSQKGFKGLDAAANPSPAAASWVNAQILTGDLAGEIRKLKAGEGKPILAIGGAGFMRNLIATGLIDEYNFVVHPVILGEGEPIFNGLSKRVDLKLIESKNFEGGIVVNTYQPG